MYQNGANNKQVCCHTFRLSWHKSYNVEYTNTPYFVVNSAATFHTFRLTVFIQNTVYVHNLILRHSRHRIKHKRPTVANKRKISFITYRFHANIVKHYQCGWPRRFMISRNQTFLKEFWKIVVLIDTGNSTLPRVRYLYIV